MGVCAAAAYLTPLTSAEAQASMESEHHWQCTITTTDRSNTHLLTREEKSTPRNELAMSPKIRSVDNTGFWDFNVFFSEIKLRGK